MVTGLCLSRCTVLHNHHARIYSALIEFCISHLKCFLFAHLPPRCTSMSLDLELAKILDEFAVPEAFRTKLLDSACLKVWQFAEYVDDVKDWTGILSSLEPPIVDRMHIASVRRAYKAACARGRRASFQGSRLSRRRYGRTNRIKQKAHIDRGACQALPLPAPIVSSAIRYAHRQVGP